MLRAVKTLALRTFGGSDKSRWSSCKSLLDEWEPRTARLVKWIPKNSRVIEFGAGNRKLQSMLDASCVYFASDFVDHSGDVLICDLNKRPLPNLSHLSPEVAVFSGVLEYVHDLRTLAEWLSAQVRKCVFSYSCLERREGVLRWIHATYRRANSGWVNSYTEARIVEIFCDVGFRCVDRDLWENQRLFLFVNQRNKI